MVFLLIPLLGRLLWSFEWWHALTWEDKMGCIWAPFDDGSGCSFRDKGTGISITARPLQVKWPYGLARIRDGGCRSPRRALTGSESLKDVFSRIVVGEHRLDDVVTSNHVNISRTMLSCQLANPDATSRAI